MDERKKILIVDDNADMLRLFKTCLEREGYEAVIADSGERALGILEQDPCFDLILLDVQMNRMSGLQVLEELERRNSIALSRVPIVFLSGREDVQSRHVAGLIPKSIDLWDFLARVKGLVERSGEKSERRLESRL